MPDADRLTPVPPTAHAPFAHRGPARFTQCPPPPPDTAEPHPGNLAYSLTLPSAVSTPAIAFEIAEVLLESHQLGRLVRPAMHLVRELMTCACRFTAAGEDVYLALRQRDGVLRVIAYDTHPRHSHPRLAAACDQRRHAALRVVPDLVRTHRGRWGFDAAHSAANGTRTWATLALTPPRRAA
ncbi:ATP-binding protein [Streptomyces sp. NPDC088400]|uniref:ATP-binding protein n=1 Tax=Streptomyces sp. NPDC088400 TaxID=3365861 RepID=UPI003828EE5C